MVSTDTINPSYVTHLISMLQENSRCSLCGLFRASVFIEKRFNGGMWSNIASLKILQSRLIKFLASKALQEYPEAQEILEAQGRDR